MRHDEPSRVVGVSSVLHHYRSFAIQQKKLRRAKALPPSDADYFLLRRTVGFGIGIIADAITGLNFFIDIRALTVFTLRIFMNLVLGHVLVHMFVGMFLGVEFHP